MNKNNDSANNEEQDIQIEVSGEPEAYIHRKVNVSAVVDINLESADEYNRASNTLLVLMNLEALVMS